MESEKRFPLEITSRSFAALSVQRNTFNDCTFRLKTTGKKGEVESIPPKENETAH